MTIFLAGLISTLIRNSYEGPLSITAGRWSETRLQRYVVVKGVSLTDSTWLAEKSWPAF